MRDPLAPNPTLVANLVFRILLSFVGIIACWVPLRLLLRHGEFAAVVFIVNVCIIDLMTILNSIIWPTDDQSTWWDGQGYCDIQVYLKVPMNTIYAASVFAIIYHLAEQVKITRAARDRRDRFRRNLLQAALIFPVPIVQAIFTYFDLSNRYVIGTLIGCYPLFDSSWPKTVIFDVPPAIFAFLSVPYAVLIWKRYRAIEKQTRGILNSGSLVAKRANRTRRRLYNMSLSILVVYVPVQIYFLIDNLRNTLSGYHPYDFNEIRQSTEPYPWDTILEFESWDLPTLVLNQPWIPVATSVVIVLFFGTTEEARQVYCEYINWFKPEKGPAPAPPPSGAGTQESGRRLLHDDTRDSIDDHQEQDLRTFLIERPEKARTTETRPSAPPRTRRRTFAQPSIPPRVSSLRHNFALRTPTLESIRRSIRIPALRSRDASGASSRPGESSRNQNPPVSLLPLHSMNKKKNDKAARKGSMEAEPDSRWRRGSFLPPGTHHNNNIMSSDRSVPGDAFQGRTPGAQTRDASGATAGRENMSRDETLSTLMSESESESGSGSFTYWHGDIGVAR